VPVVTALVAMPVAPQKTQCDPFVFCTWMLVSVAVGVGASSMPVIVCDGPSPS
jgi:hypothetical protein